MQQKRQHLQLFNTTFIHRPSFVNIKTQPKCVNIIKIYLIRILKNGDMLNRKCIECLARCYDSSTSDWWKLCNDVLLHLQVPLLCTHTHNTLIVQGRRTFGWSSVACCSGYSRSLTRAVRLLQNRCRSVCVWIREATMNRSWCVCVWEEQE